MDWIEYGDDGNGSGVSLTDYVYDDSGRLTKAVGPYASPLGTGDPLGTAPVAPPAGAYEMVFTDLYPVAAACVWRRAVEDRRGYEWWFDFDVAAPHGRLLVAQHDPIDVADETTDHPKRYEYDKYHNITKFTNELGNYWTAEYGPIGSDGAGLIRERRLEPRVLVRAASVSEAVTVGWLDMRGFTTCSPGGGNRSLTVAARNTAQRELRPPLVDGLFLKTVYEKVRG